MKLFVEMTRSIHGKSRRYTDKTIACTRKAWYKACRYKPVALLADWLSRFSTYRVTNRSAEIAYYLLLAIFPFTISLISLFGLIGRSSLINEDLMINLEGIMPAAVFDVIQPILHEIAGGQNMAFLSFSMLGVIWAASKGFSAILRGLNRIYHTGQPLHSFMLRILGLLFAVLLVLAVVLIMILITFGDLLFHQLALLSGYAFLAGRLLLFSRYIFSFILLLLLFSLLYHLVSKRAAPWRWALPASAFTSLMWLLFSLFFSFYIGNATRISSLYGSLAGVVILMFWLYFCSIVVLSGGIIHEMMIDNRKRKLAKK